MVLDLNDIYNKYSKFKGNNKRIFYLINIKINL